MKDDGEASDQDVPGFGFVEGAADGPDVVDRRRADLRDIWLVIHSWAGRRFKRRSCLVLHGRGGDHGRFYNRPLRHRRALAGGPRQLADREGSALVARALLLPFEHGRGTHKPRQELEEAGFPLRGEFKARDGLERSEARRSKRR